MKYIQDGESVYLYETRGKNMSKITQHAGSRIRAFRKARGLTPQEPTEELKDQLLFTNKELRRWQRLNMLVVDNRG